MGTMPMVTTQLPVPLHAPVQPVKIDPGLCGVAVRVTTLPVLMVVLFVHVPEVAPDVMVQLMLPVPDTVPVPVPEPVTVTVVALKAALTVCAEFMDTEQAPVPVHAPPHPAKAVPAGAVGVKATDVPWKYAALQVPLPELQLVMPAGALLTVAEVGPLAFTVRVN